MPQTPLVSIVGTPIGNLGDISKRAAETLASADVIFAEDTRQALNLLNHLNLKKRVISYHKDNEKEATAKLLSEIAGGKRAALISEAGMPCVSDPGALAVKALISKNIPFEVVQGPTAFIHGLIASGLGGGAFYFHGFLPHKKTDKIKELEILVNIPSPIIFYEAPHRAAETARLLLDYFPPPVVACRELTKIHEETIFINNKKDAEDLTLRGEFVFTVDNSKKEISEKENIIDAKETAEKFLKAGLSPKDAVKALKALGIKRNEAYKLVNSLGEDLKKE